MRADALAVLHLIFFGGVLVGVPLGYWLRGRVRVHVLRIVGPKGRLP